MWRLVFLTVQFAEQLVNIFLPFRVNCVSAFKNKSEIEFKNCELIGHGTKQFQYAEIEIYNK